MSHGSCAYKAHPCCTKSTGHKYAATLSEMFGGYTNNRFCLPCWQVGTLVALDDMIRKIYFTPVTADVDLQLVLIDDVRKSHRRPQNQFISILSFVDSNYTMAECNELKVDFPQKNYLFQSIAHRLPQTNSCQHAFNPQTPHAHQQLSTALCISSP